MSGKSRASRPGGKAKGKANPAHVPAPDKSEPSNSHLLGLMSHGVESVSSFLFGNEDKGKNSVFSDMEGLSAGGADLSGLDEEGLHAARMDRLGARRQLSDRFQIVGDDFEGERMPNQVSQDEFRKIAALFSDIRQGRTNIRFDETGSDMTGDDFRNASMADIADILTTTQGRGLMGELAHDQVEGKDFTTTIEWARNRFNAGLTDGDGGSRRGAIDGEGTNAGIRYQPGQNVDLRDTNHRYDSDAWANMSSDTVLFHELVHANHARTGVLEGSFSPTYGFSKSPIFAGDEAGPHDVGVSQEEYEAVGIVPEGADQRQYTENQYRKERSKVLGKTIPQRDTYNGSG